MQEHPEHKCNQREVPKAPPDPQRAGSVSWSVTRHNIRPTGRVLPSLPARTRGRLRRPKMEFVRAQLAVDV